MTTDTANQPAPVASRADRDDSAFLITGEGTESVAPGVWILRGQGNSIVFALEVGLVIGVADDEFGKCAIFDAFVSITA